MRDFVVLVPDPIVFAPWSVLLDRGEPCDRCQDTGKTDVYQQPIDGLNSLAACIPEKEKDEGKRKEEEGSGRKRKEAEGRGRKRKEAEGRGRKRKEEEGRGNRKGTEREQKGNRKGEREREKKRETEK